MLFSRYGRVFSTIIHLGRTIYSLPEWMKITGKEYFCRRIKVILHSMLSGLYFSVSNMSTMTTISFWWVCTYFNY